MATPDARLWSSSIRTPSISQLSLNSLTGFLYAKFVDLYLLFVFKIVYLWIVTFWFVGLFCYCC